MWQLLMIKYMLLAKYQFLGLFIPHIRWPGKDVGWSQVSN